MYQVIPVLKFYKRDEVERDVESLYIFTDNLDRTSGKNPIPLDSWYYQKYAFHCEFKPVYYPNKTQATIRGLNNAYPISTLKYYGSADEAYNGLSQFTENDFSVFEQFIDDEIAEIKFALERLDYKYLKYYAGAKIGQGTFSVLPFKLQGYLDNKLLEIGIKNSTAY